MIFDFDHAPDPGRPVRSEHRDWRVAPLDPSTNRDRPTDRHRIACVHHKIDDHLLQRDRIGFHTLCRRIEFNDQIHTIFEQWLQECPTFADCLRQIEFTDLEPPTTRKHQQSCGDVRGPITRVLNRIKVPTRGHEIGRRLPERRMTRNRQQYVIEVVGDSARQLTDRLHLLRLEQLILEFCSRFQFLLEFLIAPFQLR